MQRLETAAAEAQEWRLEMERQRERDQQQAERDWGDSLEEATGALSSSSCWKGRRVGDPLSLWLWRQKKTWKSAALKLFVQFFFVENILKGIEVHIIFFRDTNFFVFLESVTTVKDYVSHFDI